MKYVAAPEQCRAGEFVQRGTQWDFLPALTKYLVVQLNCQSPGTKRAAVQLPPSPVLSCPRYPVLPSAMQSAVGTQPAGLLFMTERSNLLPDL